MSPTNLQISNIGSESDILLRNLCELYIHDMAEFFEIDTGDDGRYSYDTSSVWKNGSQVYLVKAGCSIAGFAIVGAAAKSLSEVPVHDVHEFFIVRRYRRHGFGQNLASFLWNQHPGPWLVRVLEANAPAILFWRTAISRHSDSRYTEERRIVNGRSWVFFRFGE